MLVQEERGVVGRPVGESGWEGEKGGVEVGLSGICLVLDWR